MGCSAKVPTGPDWKSWCRAQKSPMARRYSCTKVMWNHHMTSPNFSGIFRSIYQMVAVQKGAPNLRKITLKELKLTKNNYANKSTDKGLIL